MSDGVELAAPAPPPEPKPNSFSRIIGVFFAPGETFASIVRRPDFVVPLLIIVLFSLASGVLMAQKVDFKSAARDAVEAQQNPDHPIPPDIVNKQVNLMSAIWKVAAYGAPFFSILVLVILAAILFAAFKIFGGEGEFLQAFSITIYSWYPLFIKSIIAVPALLYSKHALTITAMQNPVASNLGYFISAKQHPIAFAFLSSFDVFSIWTIILMIIGFSLMSRFSRTKTAVIILSLWAVKLLFAVGGGALQSLRMRK
jgi:hypothetical protein